MKVCAGRPNELIAGAGEARDPDRDAGRPKCAMRRYEGRRGIDDWFPMLKMGMRMEERHPFPTVVCRKRIHCA